MEEEKQVRYASFLFRMIASVIDNLLSIIVLVPVFNLFNAFFNIKDPRMMVVTGEITPQALTPEQTMMLIQNSLPSFLFQSFVVAVVIIIFWMCRGATPGKMLLKMKIVDAETLGKPTTRQFVVRFFGYIVSTLPLCLGFIWIYYDKRRQGFHDKIAGTVVVRV